MNSPYYFEIQATDIQKAKAFYEHVFGWRFTEQKGLPIEYWRIETGGINGSMLKRPAPIPKQPAGTNAYICSMQVESFDETADKIKAHGGQVALPKFAVPGKCWQGYFIDTDGNTFGLFEADEKAA